jgi:Virulence factor
MASLITVYWRDIPSQVIVKSGRQAAKRELSRRFVRAIDLAAMHAGAKGADDYLADWRRSEPVACGDDLEREAEAAAAQLEAEYDTHRLAVLAKQDGRERSR